MIRQTLLSSSSFHFASNSKIETPKRKTSIRVRRVSSQHPTRTHSSMSSDADGMIYYVTANKSTPQWNAEQTKTIAMIKLFPVWPPSGHNNHGNLQLSSLLAFCIVLLCTRATCSFAWTSSRVQSTSSHLKPQRQSILLGDDNNQGGSVGNNHVQQWWSQNNRLKFKSRRRDDDVTILFASSGNDYVNGDQEMNGEVTVMEIADALTATPAELTQPGNGYAQQAWTTEDDESDSIDTENKNVNGANDEESNYMALAKEAWTQFFSDQISEEEFLNMALDAWTDNSLIATKVDGGVGSQSAVEAMVVEMEEDFSVVEGSDERSSNGDTLMEPSEKQWGIKTGVSFLSGLFSGLNKPSDDAAEAEESLLIDKIEEDDDVPYGLRKGNSFVEESGEDIPYGLRMKSSSQPPQSTSTTDPVKNTMGVMKGKSEVKSQTKSSPLPFKKSGTPLQAESGATKGKETTASNASELSSMPPPSFKKSSVKFGVQSKLAQTKLSNGYKPDKKYNPMSKGVTPVKIKIGTPDETKSDENEEASSETDDEVVNAVAKTIEGNSSPSTKLISDGMTAEEAERIRSRRLLTDEEKALKSDETANRTIASTVIAEGMTAEEAESARLARLEVSNALNQTRKKDNLSHLDPKIKNITSNITAGSDLEATNQTRVVLEVDARSNDLSVPISMHLISDGMTAEEAESIRLSRLQSSIANVTSGPVDEKIQPEVNTTAITEGMTAEEAEQARLNRFNSIAADSIRQDGKKEEKASSPKAPPQAPSQPIETTESRQLREKIALLETKFESAVNRMKILESRIEGLDREKLLLRQDNVDLRKDLDEMKLVMEESRSSSTVK